MKRKVISANLKDGTGFPISGQTSLYQEKQLDIEMYTGLEPGFLTVYYQGKDVGVPLSNVKSLVWEKEDGNTVDRNREDKAEPKKPKSAL